MRVVFMGTPEYAARSLKALLDEGYEVAGVFTQPDRPKGRGGKLAMPPVKELALQHGIPVLQPRRIRLEGLEVLKAFRPDVCVTSAFGQILSEDILNVPPMGTVNVHASLLPKYRGSSPVNWAIIQGEGRTGVTTMLTDKGIDTGDILLQRETEIGPEETAGELTLRLAGIGAELLIDTLRLMSGGNCPKRKQDEQEMSYYPMLRHDTGAIDWDMPATSISDLVRGVNPWPCAYSESPWGTVRILKAAAESTAVQALTGTILVADPREGLIVKAGDGALRILLMQIPGGKAMPPEDFLRGHPMPEGGQMRNGARER